MNPREQSSQARVHEASLDGRDPEQLITALQFREMLDVTANGWTKYVDMSKNAWTQGSDGYLPLPDGGEPAARHGVTRSWKLHRVIDWINQRPGKIRGRADGDASRAGSG